MPRSRSGARVAAAPPDKSDLYPNEYASASVRPCPAQRWGPPGRRGGGRGDDVDYASWQRRAGGLLVDVLVGILPVVIGGSLVLAGRDAQGYIHSAGLIVLYLISQLATVVVTVHNR